MPGYSVLFTNGPRLAAPARDSRQRTAYDSILLSIFEILPSQSVKEACKMLRVLASSLLLAPLASGLVAPPVRQVQVRSSCDFGSWWRRRSPLWGGSYLY